jgi:4-hydroxyphenylpyruvate dioxygenase-like putative hemolysin
MFNQTSHELLKSKFMKKSNDKLSQPLDSSKQKTDQSMPFLSKYLSYN